MKKNIKMDEAATQRLNAICSWVEAYAPKVTRVLSNAFYSSYDAQAEKLEKEGIPDVHIDAKALDIVKSEMRSACMSFLSTGSRLPEESSFGFSYCFERNQRMELLENAVATVKKKGLLKKALANLDEADIPLSEDEKIIMLLQAPEFIPKQHYQVKATLSLPAVDSETKRKKTIRLPVKVIVADDEIKEITLLQQNQKVR